METTDMRINWLKISLQIIRLSSPDYQTLLVPNLSWAYAMKSTAIFVFVFLTSASAMAAAPQPATVEIVQTTRARDPDRADRAIGVCHLVNSLGVIGRDDPLSPVYVISPAATVSDYINMFDKRKVGLDGKATLLKGPEHGVLKEDGAVSPWGQDYRYTPVANYIGADRATFLVEIGGLQVKAVYHFNVINGGAIGGTEADDKQNCPKGMFWKITLKTNSGGTGVWS